MTSQPINDTLTALTNDSILTVGDDVNITAKGILVADDTQTLTVGGSWANAGTFTNSGGFRPLKQHVIRNPHIKRRSIQ